MFVLRSWRLVRCALGKPEKSTRNPVQHSHAKNFEAADINTTHTHLFRSCSVRERHTVYTEDKLLSIFRSQIVAHWKPAAIAIK